MKRSAVIAGLAWCVGCAHLLGYDLPQLPPIPALPPKQAVNSVPMGSAATFPEVKMAFPIETNGPFEPTWHSISSNISGNGTPAWLRQAKFGIWFHYGPQAALASGDWSAQHLYQQGATAYNNHLAQFGHPTTNGYKEVVQAWSPTNYNPSALAQLFYDAGARFVLVQGVHHDNFDTWNSRYNPWNMMNFGAKRDTMAEWKSALSSRGMRMGIAFHHEYSWWFYQPAFLSDASGTFAGIPYDAVTSTNGTGTWWQEYDPRYLYTPADLHEYQGIATPTTGYWNPGSGIFVNHLEYANWFATWWALRMLDAAEQYDPDMIYTDGTSTQPFSGFGTGTGYKCDAMQRVIAHFYNRALQRRGGLDTLAVVKFHHGDRIGTTFEGGYSSAIKTDQPWFAEMAIGDWFYRPGISYDSGGSIVRRLLEAVSRDGAMMVNIPNRPDGSFDSGVTNMLVGVGQWMTLHGEGIYGSRAWVKPADGSFRFTVGTNGSLYAFYFGTPSAGTELVIPSLATMSNLLVGPITSVALLGAAGPVSWSQTAAGLVLTCPSPMPAVPSGTAIGFKIGPSAAVGGAVPASVLAVSSTNRITVSWYHPSAAATFKVKRATTLGGPFTVIASNLAELTFADTNVTANTLYFYVVSASDAAGESADSAEASASLAGDPSEIWLSRDIGPVAAPGSFSENNGVFTVRGSGADIWYDADEFRYVFQALRGDFMMTARVANMENTANWAKAGIMVRDTLNPDSKYVINFISPVNGIALQQRQSSGGQASGVATAGGLAAPHWLRLVRAGELFNAYRSQDGTNWILLGSTAVAMNESCYAGLAVCSVNDGTLNESLFDNVSITTPQYPGSVSNLRAAAGDGVVGLSWSPAMNAGTYRVARAISAAGPFSAIASGISGTVFLDSSLTNGVTYHYTLTAENGLGEGGASPAVSATPAPVGLPAGWFQADVGPVAAAGGGGESSGAFFISGSGADVWFASDEFHFVYLKLTNDCSITARVPYVQFVQNTSKAGLMIRESLGADSRHAFVDVTPSTTFGVEFIRRINTGGSTSAAGSPGVTAPVWLRLVRQGDTFSAFRSADGVAWTAVGSPVNISMTAGALVGLAVNSHLDGTLCKAWFDNVCWEPAPPPVAPSWISATEGDGEATLSWAATLNASGYNLKRSTTSGGPYSTVAADRPETSLIDSGLQNGTVYFYAVSATNSTGEGPLSTEIAVRPISTASPKFSFGVEENHFQVSWPKSHQGWRLETQTNSLAAGLGSNWVAVPGSTTVTQMTFPISAGNGAVFFRLRHP